ncbi:MAG: hypothetical protein ACI9U2_000784 [Bradymonadia bacterium]|jgi:hypothetical protein
MRRFLMPMVLALVWGCDDGGDGSGDAGEGMGGAGGGVSAGPPTPIEGSADTLAFAATIDRMRAVAEAPGIAKGNIGDPAVYVGSEATSPTDDTALSSLYYESGALEEAVGRLRDRRPQVDKDDSVGERIQNRIASALTIGWATDTPSGRGGPRWHALHAALSLDQYLLLAVYTGLVERSASGFDRALGVLWDANGDPHGLGALIAKADAFCGTSTLNDVAAQLSSVRAPLIAELEASGLPDALGRRVIEEGALPAYETAVEQVTVMTAEAMQRLFAAELTETAAGSNGQLDAARQARALMRYAVVAPWLAANAVEGAAELSAELDAANAADVDVDAVLTVLRAAGTPCDR